MHRRRSSTYRAYEGVLFGIGWIALAIIAVWKLLEWLL